MERLKFWLLDAVHHRDELVGQAVRGTLFTQVAHGQDPAIAAKLIVELGRAGLVEFRYGASLVSPSELDPEHSEASYSLTEAGGVAWEEVAKPEWTKAFREKEIRLNDEAVVRRGIPEVVSVFSCGSVELMKKLLDGLCPKSSRLYVSPTYEISEWKPLYWKTLSNGFRTVVVTDDQIHGDIDGDWRWDEEVSKWREFGFNLALCQQLPAD